MEIKEKYIRKYWYKMVEDQVCDEYESKGYSVVREYKYTDNYRADIYAYNDTEKILIELITGRKNKEHIIDLYKHAIASGYEFRVVTADYCHLDAIMEFDEFAEIFVEYLNNNNPGEFGEFATHSRVEDMEEYTFKSISVHGNCIEAEGDCVVELETWFDNEGDTDYTYHVPISFTAKCVYEKGKWIIDDCESLNIDTSQLD